MKNIIVPVDFSMHSEYALKAAAKIARKYNAEILALHMLELSDTYFTKTDLEQNERTVYYIKLAEMKFEQFLNKDYLKGITITPVIKHFKVFSEVNSVAEDHDVDLIVMGSHGSSGAKEVFIGSNTEKVVRYSNCPVLIIKNDPVNLNFETIVFACDFYEASISAYLKASKIFKKMNSKLILLHVNLPFERFESTTEIQKRVADFLKKANGDVEELNNVRYVSDYTVEKGILNYSNLIGADLTAMATHGRTGISHFFEGSISEDIANHATLPVMTFKI